VLFFAYGANMRSEAMEELLAHKVRGQPALLRGFRVAFSAFSEDWQGGVADLVRDPAGEVEGVAFALQPTDLLRLDVVEGLSDNLYKRRTVRIELADGAEEAAVAYEIEEKHPHVQPSAHYLDAMISGATDQGLSEAYIAWLLQLYPDEPSPQRPAFDSEE
jgi:gamma-glutamylcyclotransferase